MNKVLIFVSFLLFSSCVKEKTCDFRTTEAVQKIVTETTIHDLYIDSTIKRREDTIYPTISIINLDCKYKVGDIILHGEKRKILEKYDKRN